MKKVLIIHRSLGLGGAEKSIVFVANSLIKYYQIEILLLEQRDCSLTVDKGIRIAQENCYSDRPIVGKGMISGFRELEKMRMIIKKKIEDYLPDLVICFDLRILLCLYFSGLNKKKIIFSERADPNENPLYWQKFLGYVYPKLGAVVFQTKGARNFYKKSFKSTVIPNAAFSRIDHSIQQDVVVRKKVIFSAGRFQYRKGFDLLIKSFANVSDDFPDYRLIIYGNGEEENNLRKLIVKHELDDKILLLPPLNNVIYKNRDASLFVLPSRSEGIPNILIEAMMEKLPCIASNCTPGGAALLSDDGKYCLLADNNSVDSLTAKLRYALMYSKDMEQLAIEAQKSMGRFDPNKVKFMWYDVVKKTIR